MPTDLARHIEETPLCDTHEHLRREPDWVDDGPDILRDLFENADFGENYHGFRSKITTHSERSDAGCLIIVKW